MGDIQRLGSGFALSINSPLFRSSLELPKIRMGEIQVPEAARTQVINAMEPGKASAEATIGATVRTIGDTLRREQALMLRTADGRALPAAKYLSPTELRQLARLPEHYQRRILRVSDIRGTASQIHAQLRQNIKQVIEDLTLGARIQFKEKDNRQWSVANLLDLALAIHQLPLAHRKQLDGVTFVRDDEPDFGYKGQSPDLMQKLANKMVAGHYDLKTRSVILYDRGLQDSFPILDADMQQSLRNIQRRNPADLRVLQKMLNPYLAGLGASPLAEDGRWSAHMESAVRLVQARLLDKYLTTHYQLTPAQREELQQLQTLVRSPQFTMIARVVGLKDKMKHLNLLPDPQMQKLLSELARSEFGEASLQFLLQDISDVFRINRHVSRTEEVMIHEMGHHMQLGLSNENEYVAEFGKLSGWVERESGEIADGYIQGASTAEDIVDVYQQLASENCLDAGHYGLQLTPQERSQRFVTTYASTDPMEDFAESYKTFVLNPVHLIQRSPEKFFFINALPSIQSRKMGSGAREKTHYQDAAILEYVRAALRNQYQTEPTQAQVEDFIRQQFHKLIGADSRSFQLSPETILALVETHRSLLERINMPYISPESIYAASDPDYAVLKQIHEQTLALIQSQGNDEAAKDFFYSFTNPREVERRFPKASPELRENLKDPAFASMMLALGKIGGYALMINQAKNVDLQDQQNYREAQEYFTMVLQQPSALLSKQIFTQSYHYLRGLSSGVINPEANKIAPALDFFRTLEADPAQAFPEGWYQFPEEFKDMLRNRRFIQAVSGDQGRYIPSPQVIRETLQKIKEMIEFKRGIELLRNG